MNTTVESAVRPFPWRALPRTTRREAAIARFVRAIERDGRHHPRVGAWIAQLEATVGAPVTFRLRSVGAVQREGMLSSDRSALAVVLESDAGSPTAFVEAEGPLAAVLVSKALGRPVNALRIDLFATPPPEVCGAFAALIGAALRKGSPDAPLPFLIAAAGPSKALLSRRGLPGETIVSVTVLVDGEAYLMRIGFDDHAMNAMDPEPPADAAAIARLGDVRLDLPVIGWACATSVRAIAALAPGVVWIPEGVALRALGRGIAGDVVLAAPRSERGVRANLGADGRLVLVGEVEDLSMSDEQRALIENVGDVPVVVRIELGATEMRAQEWARLRPGDVVATGRPIGSAVTLRAGGHAIARGELVEIEGEIGVRILPPEAP